MEVRRVMTCLTITPDTAAEAIAQQADLIVSHHPLPFRPLTETGDGNHSRSTRVGTCSRTASPSTALTLRLIPLNTESINRWPKVWG